MIGVRRLGDEILRKNLLLVPLRDFFSLFIWSAALFGKRVEWRDRVFMLENEGKMRPEFGAKTVSSLKPAGQRDS
jgi:hypothetical protein